MPFCLEDIDFVSPCFFSNWKGNRIMIQITSIAKNHLYFILLLELTPGE